MTHSHKSFRPALVLAACLCLPAVLLLSGPVRTQDSKPWVTEAGREHPLTGKLYDTARREFIEPAAMLEQFSNSRFVLLGEKHDNPDHHHLQAWVLRQLIAAGRKPSVAFEMFGTDTGPAIARHLAEHPGDADGIAEAVNWEKSGWPDWAMYRPIVEAGVEAGLPILAANLPREKSRALNREGVSALDEALVRDFQLAQPLTSSIQTSMDKEIREAHCGMANDTVVEAMIQGQRARDATMAGSLLAGEQKDGGVLITGNGHARTDRGVPAYLRLRSPEVGVKSLAFLEVTEGKILPEEYSDDLFADSLPFDFVWFTPRVDDLDPCEKFRESLEKLPNN